MKINRIVPATALAVLAFAASPSSFASAPLDPAPRAEKSDVKPYPLKTCIVSDDKLGEMGKPVVFVREGQEIKLCCKDCRDDFDKDPATYLKKLEKK
jgi:hypothetical protein